MNIGIDKVISVLKENGLKISMKERTGNGLGTKITLEIGCVINCWDSGKLSFQGKNTDKVKELFSTTMDNTTNRKVFVVYGHDSSARTQLEAMLRRWNFEPIIIDQLASSGATIIEKIEEYTKDVSFGIVLATPDDVGYARNCENDKKYRARQNVVLELGMLLAKIGRSKVAILLSQAEDMEKPSDIDGLIYIPFKDNVEETRLSLAKELENNGYSLDINKL